MGVMDCDSQTVGDNFVISCTIKPTVGDIGATYLPSNGGSQAAMGNKHINQF